MPDGNTEDINAKFISEFVSTLDMGAEDFLMHPRTVMALMGWSKEELQQAINDGRVCLINWEEGGQSICLPGSRWLDKPEVTDQDQK